MILEFFSSFSAVDALQGSAVPGGEGGGIHVPVLPQPLTPFSSYISVLDFVFTASTVPKLIHKHTMVPLNYVY